MPIELSGSPKGEFVFNINTNNIVIVKRIFCSVWSALISPALALLRDVRVDEAK